jgi:phosphoribosyl-AMP cyclohydrolase
MRSPRLRVTFHPRRTVEEVEEGQILAPRFGADGLIPCVTTDAGSGEVLMLGWMNAEALRLTLETGEAHYDSRSRQVLWRKGATSGLVQRGRVPPVRQWRGDGERLRAGRCGGLLPAALCRTWRQPARSGDHTVTRSGGQDETRTNARRKASSLWPAQRVKWLVRGR